MGDYQYLPIGSGSHIRLIKFDYSATYGSDLLSIQLTEARLDESFEALSYTWGDPSERVPIKVGNRALTITPNLDNFLKRLRDEECANGYKATYWADQICINQKDIPERNSQVALMASIYRESRRSLVWLGEAEDGDTAALQLLEDIDRLGFTKGDPLNLVLPRVVDTMEARLRDAPGQAEEGPAGDGVGASLLGLMNRTWQALLLP